MPSYNPAHRAGALLKVVMLSADLLPAACQPASGHLSLLLQNWGLLELPTGQGEEHQLHIFYTMLPCLTVFGYNPSAPTGADFKSARCLSPAYSNLVQNKTGLDMHDVRISGHPVVSRRRDDGRPSELLFLAHHSWRQHGGAAHWAVLVDVETCQVGTSDLRHRGMCALVPGGLAFCSILCGASTYATSGLAGHSHLHQACPPP